MLTEKQKEKYHRNIMLKDIGEKGQEKLLASRVLCVGAGGLGSAVLYYLAAAGVGALGIVDSDTVEPGNLQRQILYNERDIGRDKVASAAQKISYLNADVKVDAIRQRFDAENAAGLIRGYDLIIDAVDNFPSKYAISDACVTAKMPFIHAGALGMRGQVMTYLPGRACLRCVMPKTPPDAETAADFGILGAVAGHLGALQAMEAVNFLALAGPGLAGKMLVFESVPYKYRILEIRKHMLCPSCGHAGG